MDLFSKKYLMIPICENEHWSLAIICNPQLIEKPMFEHIEKCKSGYYEDLLAKKKEELMAIKQLR